MIDPTAFRTLTFDCYGTLIDWETGILEALRPLLFAHGLELGEEALLEFFGELESEIEAEAYRPYREVLSEVVYRLGRRLGFVADAREARSLPDSVAHWPAFPDTAEALQALARRYELVVVSNIDDELFAGSAPKLGVPLHALITAKQVGAYKPSRRMFEAAIARIGRPTSEILHVAQSLFHDIVPAQAMGLATVWVNRRAGKTGSGATPPGDARPDLEVPDLATLARRLVQAEGRG